MTPTRLRVQVRLPPETALPVGVRVRVDVEDVGRADARAPLLAAETFPIPPETAELLGPFELEAELPPGGDYAVRVHVDRAGDGRVAAGDLVSVAKHAVPAARARADIEVPVRPVPAAA